MKWIHDLIDASIEHRGFVLLGTLLFVFLGIVSLRDLKFDAYPDLTNTQVQVVTASAGMSASEVERLITMPIERELGGVPGVEELRSLSRTGISSVTIVFDEDTELWRARQLVKERLDAASNDIPEDAGTPELGPPSTGLGEVYQFIMRSDRHTMPQLYRVFERDVAPRLRAAEGVVEVNAWGGGRPQLDVMIDPMKLAAHGLNIHDVHETIDAAIGRVSGGAIISGPEQVLVRGVSNPTTPEELEELVITVKTPHVRIGDIAHVREGKAMTVGMGSSDTRGEAIFVMVQLLAGADALGTVEQIDERMKKIREGMPPGVELELVYARDKLVGNTLETVSKSLIEGGLLVIFVLFLLMGDLRAGLLVASVIPLSLLGAFIGLSLTGYSGNLMSLGAIDFGLVVDGSIVITESIVALTLSRDASLRAAITSRTKRVSGPVFFAVGILILVYTPILALWGTEGKLFRPMALTVLFALLTALILSFTYVPAAATLIVRPRGDHQPWIMRWMLRAYKPTLALSRAHAKLTGVVVVAALLGSVALGATLGVEFVPRLEEGDIVVQTTRLPSLSPEEALRGATQVESILLEFPEVETVGSRTGAPAVATDPMGLEEADILVRLAPRDQWTSASSTSELVDAIEHALTTRAPDAQYNFTQPIEMRFNEMLEGITGDIGIKVFGPDLDELNRIANEIADRVESLEGAADVTRPSAEQLPNIRVIPSHAALARHGVRADAVLDVVEASQRGVEAGEVIRANFRDRIVLKLDRAANTRLQDTPVVVDSGESVTLDALATLDVVGAPAIIEREAGSRRAIIELNVRGRDLGSFIQDAQLAVDGVALPPGYWIEWGGKYEQLRTATARVGMIVPLVLVMIIALLFLAFRRVKPTLLIALNVPVALSGGVMILWLRGLPWSMSAIIGCLALFGIAVMNGIVMLSRAQELNASLPGEDAAHQAAMERFRPVLTTALVAGLGFVPMALATGVGAEVQRPLATVVIGGLFSSTVLTLVALPTLYGAWHRDDEQEGAADEGVGG